MREAWVYGCGGCGRDIYLLADLSIESRVRMGRTAVSRAWPDPAPEPCGACKQVIATGRTEMNGDDLIRACLVYLMDWCKCGNPEDATGLAMLYLETMGTSEKLPGEVLLLLAYICDFLEWTDHGGSVYGSWLTDTGREALRKYQEETREDPEQAG